jgi:hypothetical protein
MALLSGELPIVASKQFSLISTVSLFDYVNLFYLIDLLAERRK